MTINLVTYCLVFVAKIPFISFNQESCAAYKRTDSSGFADFIVDTRGLLGDVGKVVEQ